MANRANLSVQALDPRGIAGRLGEGVDIAAWRGTTLATLLDEQRMSQEALRILAAGTGGAAFVDTSNFAHALDVIRQDNGVCYLLGYRAPRAPKDGKYHQIDVRALLPGGEAPLDQQNGQYLKAAGCDACRFRRQQLTKPVRTFLNPDPRPAAALRKRRPCR